jgi:hypothetical protein
LESSFISISPFSWIGAAEVEVEGRARPALEAGAALDAGAALEAGLDVGAAFDAGLGAAFEAGFEDAVY